MKIAKNEKISSKTPVPTTGEIYENLNKSGRFKLPEEEKAQSISLRLHKDHIEKLSFIKGEGTAEKVRHLIDSHITLQYRYKRQSEFLARRVRDCHERMKKATRPSDPATQKKWKEGFKSKLEEIISLMEIYFLSPEDLKTFLAEEDYDKFCTISFAAGAILKDG